MCFYPTPFTAPPQQRISQLTWICDRQPIDTFSRPQLHTNRYYAACCLYHPTEPVECLLNKPPGGNTAIADSDGMPPSRLNKLVHVTYRSCAVNTIWVRLKSTAFLTSRQAGALVNGECILNCDLLAGGVYWHLHRLGPVKRLD